MITRQQLVEIGYFGKPHGVTGEINFSTDTEVDPSELSCIIMEIEGIYVPFFINSVRPKGVNGYLLSIDGYDTEAAVSGFANKAVYALSNEVEQECDMDDDGFYATDLIGYKVSVVGDNLTGEITGVDDSTDNVLFEICTDSERRLLIPVVDDFIVEIDVDSKRVVMSLPDGLLDL